MALHGCQAQGALCSRIKHTQGGACGKRRADWADTSYWDPMGRGPGQETVTRPGVEPVLLPAGVLGFYAAQREALGADPVSALAQGRPCVTPPTQGEGEDAMLVERDTQGQVQVGGGSPSLVRLLAFLRMPRSRAAALGHARLLGCDPGEDVEVLDGLLDDGLVVTRG